jgi:hypothetical protein
LHLSLAKPAVLCAMDHVFALSNDLSDDGLARGAWRAPPTDDDPCRHGLAVGAARGAGGGGGGGVGESDVGDDEAAAVGDDDGGSSRGRGRGRGRGRAGGRAGRWNLVVAERGRGRGRGGARADDDGEADLVDGDTLVEVRCLKPDMPRENVKASLFQSLASVNHLQIKAWLDEYKKQPSQSPYSTTATQKMLVGNLAQLNVGSNESRSAAQSLRGPADQLSEKHPLAAVFAGLVHKNPWILRRLSSMIGTGALPSRVLQMWLEEHERDYLEPVEREERGEGAAGGMTATEQAPYQVASPHAARGAVRSRPPGASPSTPPPASTSRAPAPALRASPRLAAAAQVHERRVDLAGFEGESSSNQVEAIVKAQQATVKKMIISLTTSGDLNAADKKGVGVVETAVMDLLRESLTVQSGGRLHWEVSAQALRTCAVSIAGPPVLDVRGGPSARRSVSLDAGALIRLIEIATMRLCLSDLAAARAWDEVTPGENGIPLNFKSILVRIRESWDFISGGSGAQSRQALDAGKHHVVNKWAAICDLMGNRDFQPGLRSEIKPAMRTVTDANVNAAVDVDAASLQSEWAQVRSVYSTFHK